MNAIKLTAGSLVNVTRDFSGLRIAGDKLCRNITAKRGLYVFKGIGVTGITGVSDTILLEKIGGTRQFYCPVKSTRQFENYGVINYEITADLLEKVDITKISNLNKLRFEISKRSEFHTGYKKASRGTVLRLRHIYAKRYLESREVVVTFCDTEKKLPLVFDGKHFKTFKTWIDVTYGVSRAKIIPSNELSKYNVDYDALKTDYFTKYGDYSASIHTMTLNLVKMLSDWHIDKNVGSCMLRDNVTESRLKSFYRFYRRNGFKMTIIHNQAGNIIARAIIGKNGNYTRIYSMQGSIDKKIEAALTEVGCVKVGGYNGTFISYKNKDDTLCIPYIDGCHNFNMVDDDYVTASNGKLFALCEFSTCGEFKADSQEFGVVIEAGTVCDCCGQTYDSDREGTTTASGQAICDSCYDYEYFYCDECNEVLPNADQTRFIYEDSRGNFHENWCCESCADNMDSIPFRRG